MEVNQLVQLFLSILFLPMLSTIFFYSWGAGDPLEISALKKIFLVLPVGAIILGYWTSIVGFVSVIFRSDRKAFLSALLITWWDLGRAIFSLWGGTFKFFFHFVIAILNFLRIIVLGVWMLIQDILLTPIRLLKNVGYGVLNPEIPWLAVGLTLFWGVLEAVIFTFVMTPLVIDTLSNMTGQPLTEAFVRIPLFLFMLFIILGSYAVLSTWASAVATKNIPAILKITIIELVSMFIEIIFLYREFVDALVPWFAQHSGGKANFGIAGTLIIAGLTWLGVRALSWFLFAAAGTPTLMAIIQGTGIEGGGTKLKSNPMQGSFILTGNLIGQIKSEAKWIQEYSNDLLGSFILPPLNVIAAGLNFLMLLLIGQHLFDLPFKNISELKEARELLQKASAKR
ncbi:MAG: hypothetical protein A4S09_12480 [Proteobacteria bacterium SG_bin7]|nr:MAG: hypothetical protein A4S09_12480 [Proteobacteria bacterium SG_bin7]